MSQKKVQTQKTLGQKTEDRLMQYILDNNIAIGEKLRTNLSLHRYSGLAEVQSVKR